jgi:hypothetical protein
MSRVPANPDPRDYQRRSSLVTFPEGTPPRVKWPRLAEQTRPLARWVMRFWRDESGGTVQRPRAYTHSVIPRAQRVAGVAGVTTQMPPLPPQSTVVRTPPIRDNGLVGNGGPTVAARSSCPRGLPPTLKRGK